MERLAPPLPQPLQLSGLDHFGTESICRDHPLIYFLFSLEVPALSVSLAGDKVHASPLFPFSFSASQLFTQPVPHSTFQAHFLATTL